MGKQVNEKIVNSGCSSFQKLASKRDEERSSVDDLVNGDCLMNPGEYVSNHGSILSLQPWIFRKGSYLKDKEMTKANGDHFEKMGSEMDVFSNNSLAESSPRNVNLSYKSGRGQSSLRNRSSRCKSNKPLSSLENCLIPHLYNENFEFKEFDFSSSSTLSSMRPLVVTDGNKIIRKNSYDHVDVNFDSGIDNTNMENISGVSPLPGLRTPKRKSRDILPDKLGPSNTRRPRRLIHRKGTIATIFLIVVFWVETDVICLHMLFLFLFTYVGWFRLNWTIRLLELNSVDVLHVFSVGVSFGIISAILSNEKEIDNLKDKLKSSENLVQDLQEELEMKDTVIVKELAHEACGHEKPSDVNSELELAVKGKNNQIHSPAEASRSEIEAELEIELEKLEISMKSGKMSELDELHPDLLADGELKGEKLPGRVFEDQSTSANDSRSSSLNLIRDANYSVSPCELSLRLHEVIQLRLQERIKELETALHQTQKQLQLLESDHLLTHRAFSSSDMGSSSNLDSPTGTAGNFALVRPFCLNLTGEALDAYDEVYEEFVQATNMEQNQPTTTYSGDQRSHYLHSSDKNLIGQMDEPKFSGRESMGDQNSLDPEETQKRSLRLLSAPAMADGNPNSNPGVLESLGEEIVRIVAPVSACMLLVVLLVTSLHAGGDGGSAVTSIATIAYSEEASDSFWDKLEGALLNSLVFVVVITVLTFLLVLLFYFRCMRFLKSYMAFSSFVVLGLLGGQIFLFLIARFYVPIDVVTFSLLLLNFSVVGVMAVFLSKVPILVNQGYLVTIGVLVAYWFTLLPEWTTWALLVAMSLYDLAAVLLPGGPLRLLVELAISRDEELPALVYEARPVEQNQPGAGRRLWRERRDTATNSSSNLNGLEAGNPNPQSQEANLVVAEEDAAVSAVTAPLLPPQLERRREEDAEGIGLGSSGAIKLGLGDFIFYSVLVGRAALYDFMTVYACYLAIMAGLAITLLLLAVYRKALPALPVSIALGILFYLLTRYSLEVFMVQCSTNLLMF
ncbi:hypothetical protein ZIOFF_017831 [Zingiber officinale]|uniref:Presenilin n=2 Tax=Zingiber officinale TaxID=94328 RepID=A0A8J5LIH6_ZINOF|nr:hypothetical protein ZIOFF_017831 [Zingiber officinale]